MLALLTWSYTSAYRVGRCIRAAVGWPMPENNFHVYLASSFLVGNSAMWESDVLFGPIAKWLGMARKPPP